MLNKIKTPQIKALEKAINIVGNQAVFAEKLGLKFQAQISSWVCGRRPIPSKHCIKIETLTGGKVTRYQLRPDVFGKAPKANKAA